MNSLDYFELLGGIIDYAEDNYEVLSRWSKVGACTASEILTKRYNIYLFNPNIEQNCMDFSFLIEDSWTKSLRDQGKINLNNLSKLLDKKCNRKPIERDLWEDEFD